MYLPSPIHSKYINKEALLRYLPVGGVRIEDDILITSSGYENLTTAPNGEDMLRIIKSQDNDASQAIVATETDEVPVVVPAKVKDSEWLNTFSPINRHMFPPTPPPESENRPSGKLGSGESNGTSGMTRAQSVRRGGPKPQPLQSITTESQQYKPPVPPNCQNVIPDAPAKRHILESRKTSQQEGKAIETPNRLSRSSEPQPEVSLVSRPKLSRFRGCAPCNKRMVC